MSRRPGVAFAVAVAAIAAAVPAQSQRQPRDASTRLHAARLRELLDLDVRGAVSDYQAVAVERGSFERWIAVARLEELRRLGIKAPQPAPMTDAPKDLLKALPLLTPLALPELTNRAAQLPAEPLRESSSPDAPLLDLHPASAAAQVWVRSQSSLSASARFEMRRSLPTQPPDESRSQAFANDILRRELEGRTQVADSLRERDFRGWRVPTPSGTPAEVLVRVRGNLDAWIKESAGNSAQTELLVRLRDELEQRQASNIGEAVQLAMRLPRYTERLVADPPKPESGKPEQGR